MTSRDPDGDRHERAGDRPRRESAPGRAEEFDATGVDVLVGNAVLARVPTHRDLLRRRAGELPPGGRLAFQVLQGPDPVLDRLRGTGLRPALGALDTDRAAEFERERAALLRAAHPARDDGTPFAFRRTVAVAHRPRS